MILRASLLLLAAAAIAAANAHKNKKPKDPPREPEEEDDEQESYVGAITSVSSEAEEKTVAEDIEHREAAMETKLLALYLHKERKSRFLALRRDVEEKIDEIVELEIKLKSLEAEVNELVVKQGKLQQEEIRELELANKTVQKLRKRLKLEADTNRLVEEKMKMIQERVSSLQDGELCQSKRGVWVEEKLRVFELELLRMKRRNRELEMEKRVLSIKLVVARESSSKFDLPIMNKREVPSELEEELKIAKQANDELLKQVDTLQKSRFSMVEELVYQRRIHACLKFDYSGKPWRRQSSSHSETDYNSSSGTSSPSIITRRSSSSSSMEKSKTNLIRKIKNCGKRKDDFRARRFSTSMVPSMLSGNSRLAEEPRKRRVSFNYHVNVFQLTNEMCAEELWATEPESGSDSEQPTAAPPGYEIGVDKVSRLSAETGSEVHGKEATKLDDDAVRGSDSEEGFNSGDRIISLSDQAAVGIGVSHVVPVFLCFCFVVAVVVDLIRLLFGRRELKYPS